MSALDDGPERAPEPVQHSAGRAFTSAETAAMARKIPGPVTLADREGVFVHSFKCSVCDLEFALFSGRANRHVVGRTCCPECGVPTPMLHWRGQTSWSVEFDGDPLGAEIYQLCPPVDGPLLDDSIPASDDRFDLGPVEESAPTAEPGD